MTFNRTKCKVLVLNVKKEGLSFTLNGDEGELCDEIELADRIKYLGVTLSRTRLNTLYREHTKKVLDKANVRLNSIKHLGYHRDGFRPETSTRMYKILVRPILEYAAQVLSFRYYYMKERENVPVTELTITQRKYEKFQNRALKYIVPCPRMTTPALVRLFTGTMPIVARLDILKLRYFWKIHLGKTSKLAHEIYLFKRNHFLQSNVGFVHEVFNICCKYDCMDIWHGLCPKGVSPKTMIKKRIEAYHYKEDLKKADKTKCLYTSLTCFERKKMKYKFDERFSKPGNFQSSEHRRWFIYALFDTCSYHRECCRCGEYVLDMIQHCLRDCKSIQRQRDIFFITMRFYNLPPECNMTDKRQLFLFAQTKQCYLNILCQFLKEVGKTLYIRD